jgi:hypothetical protein
LHPKVLSGGSDELMSTLSLVCAVGRFAGSLLRRYRDLLRGGGEQPPGETALTQYLFSKDITVGLLEYTLDKIVTIGRGLEAGLSRKHGSSQLQEGRSDRNQISFILFSIERAVDSVSTCLMNLKGEQ